ncbi:hypothetical protein CMK15_05685 [Candidatus Poribacteria bacterium]|nr:hypothetical protein [Candidatus Poribacteria bacterium]
MSVALSILILFTNSKNRIIPLVESCAKIKVAGEVRSVYATRGIVLKSTQFEPQFQFLNQLKLLILSLNLQKEVDIFRKLD